MRTITEKAIEKFLNAETFKSGNTSVEETATTKERLNGLPNVHIKQIKGKWFLNDVEWDGKLIDVNN